MKQHIIVDDRYKIGQYLLGIAKSLMPGNKSIKIVSEAEINQQAISPSYNLFILRAEALYSDVFFLALDKSNGN